LLAQAPLNVPVESVDRRDLVYYPGDTERIVPLTRKLAREYVAGSANDLETIRSRLQG